MERSVLSIEDILIEKSILKKDELDILKNESSMANMPLEKHLFKKGLITPRKLDQLMQEKEIGRFEKLLPVTIFVFIILGMIVGKFLPGFVAYMDSLKVGNVVSIPIAVCLFFMMFPIMLSVDFGNLKQVVKEPKAIALSTFFGWLIQPPIMFVLAWLFLFKVFAFYLPSELASQYMAGIILVGIAPCTAMVLMWTYLSKAKVEFTLVLCAINVILILLVYAPIATFLLGRADIKVPFYTLAQVVFIYVGISLLLGFIVRQVLIKNKSVEWYNVKFLPKIKNVSTIALLIALLIIFSSQGRLIIDRPATIAIIALPLLIGFFVIFVITFFTSKALKIEYGIAAPASIVSSSNHFELGIVTAIFLFGLNSGAALATVVVPLIEVPIMLLIVKICLRNRYKFSFFKKG